MNQDIGMMFEELAHSQKFGRIHHRFLNDLQKLSALLTHCDNDENYHEIAEGDLCWYEKHTGEMVLFMNHPLSFNRLPSYDRIEERLRAGNITSLADVLDADFGDIILAIELKRGMGDSFRAIEQAVELLEEKAKNRYWIDSFSPDLLRMVKSVNPSTPTSLHTRYGVYGKYVVINSWIPPFFGLLNLYQLEHVDAITVTRQYLPARFFRACGVETNHLYRHVIGSGKKLLFGGLTTEKTFLEVQASSAIAGYKKWGTEFEKPLTMTYE